MVKSWNGSAWSDVSDRHAEGVDLSDYGDVVGGSGLAIGCTEPLIRAWLDG